MYNHDEKFPQKERTQYIFKDCTDTTLELLANEPKPKSTPWKPTDSQRTILEAIFKYENKPTVSLRDEIAVQLDIPKKSARIWFMNRAARKQRNLSRSIVEEDVNKDEHLSILVEIFLSKVRKGSNVKNFFKNETGFAVNDAKLIKKQDYYDFQIVDDIEDDFFY
ncbi:Homeobox protein Wariai [Cucumispora dikerogammari]|nr:Homeobox protein Wariai [Cucumispora dikerogammari]